ncbi:hypothetical protein COCNU_13G006900 [Cocos nucifera]|uniref:Uncharacterized protein n=1 Tax=Cocos nucifera TaxID=13894 RepID=A0A8K0NCA1_COCNU|nr:hypothetical protein COCNU_13G006900 [Cocos nucifera]
MASRTTKNCREGAELYQGIALSKKSIPLLEELGLPKGRFHVVVPEEVGVTFKNIK